MVPLARAFFVAFYEDGNVTDKAFKHLSGNRSLDDQVERWLLKVTTSFKKDQKNHT